MVTPTQNPEVSTPRRRVLRQLAMAGTASLAFPFINKGALAADKRIVVRDPGGPYSEAFAEAFYRPFKAATGIEVVPVVAQSDPTAMIKGMVEAKNFAWDMALLNRQSQEVLTDPSTGVFLEEVRVNAPEIPARYNSPYMIATLVLQTVLAVRTDKFKDRPLPNSWADFWDIKNFPGRRALRRAPQDTLEEAFLGGGGAAASLYPIDAKAAFASLDRIKKNVNVWWTSGAQTSQILKSGEVDICPTWNARAQAAIDEGAPVKIIWNQGLWSTEGFCILKGTPKADICREFIKFTCDAKRQATYTKILTYGPSNPDAYKFIDPVRAKALPTHPDNISRAIQIDAKYWGKSKDKLTESFNTWLLA
ncbi:dehydrogenase [Cupriavidus necator]|uniref:ABC transporter substrate-binding protein n=1 Tax=Cupriavidus TaxID=106589 RepID=UPI00056BB450|nr:MULTISPECIES: ABC transporter substrate-binding protein [Cupriavidus]KUE85959.1 dehydrogenase [Cupriavidus necator]